MADSSNSPMKTTTEEQTPPGPNNPTPAESDRQDSSDAPTSVTPTTTTAPVNPIPNSIPSIQPTPQQPTPTAMAPPQIQPYVPPPQVSTVPPSFRPAAPPVPLPTAPQFSPLPNPNFQNPGGQVQVQVQVQPPGVMMPPPSSGGVSSVPQMMPQQYLQPGQQPVRMYSPMPNGYQVAAPQGQMPPPGMLRYPPPLYASMIRPAYPQRLPGAVGIIPAVPRPPIMGIRNPVIPTIVRPPIIPTVTPTEKPQTTVYVGKIASTVENDFMLSLLQLCGPVKSWKRAQDPTTGALKGFGFCEFESAEGVLRALRLLSKLSIDGQELMLNVNQATREYLERYVEKKKENMKNLKSSEAEGAQKELDSESAGEPPKPSLEDSKEVSKEDAKEDNKEASKENNENANFGLVSNEDKEADREATEKLTGMIEERIKNKPLPPPPPPPQTSADVSGNSNMELPARDGDSDVDVVRNAEDKNDDEMTSNSKPSSEQERPETSSPDRSNKNDRRSRDRDRDLKREKERELERYEREREQERAKREREREYKIREDERRYRARLKEWESREKEKERARKQEREREKDREQDRLYEIMDQESEDGYSKKRKYKSSGEEREERKRRMREKEEDVADRIKEEEEIAEAKRRAEEERARQKEQQKHALELLSVSATNGTESVFLDKSTLESRDKAVEQNADGGLMLGNDNGNGVIQNGNDDESVTGSLSATEPRQSNSAPTKKLGFGLVGSGKRTTVPSVFHEEEDEESQKDKKMRPLVPIDYSTEELQAVRETTPVAPSPNLAAAAEFAKRIGNANSKEERSDSERERGRRPHDRSSQRERDRNAEETYRPRDESRKESVEWDKERDRGLEKIKTPDNKKLLDAKQLIDTIPKTKDELFSYEINWAIYDKNGLHERMRPWISKKITDFLGEEETTLVDYIVSSTQEHVKADEMLDRLQSILDDEAEMFVLKMWRMLIFEIKKVETGLASRPKT